MEGGLGGATTVVFLGVGFAGPRSHRRFSRNSTTIRNSPAMMLSGVPASVGSISEVSRMRRGQPAPRSGDAADSFHTTPLIVLVDVDAPLAQWEPVAMCPCNEIERA